VHAVEPQAGEPAKVEMDIEKFKGYTLPCSDHTQMELIEVHGESFHSQIHKPYGICTGECKAINLSFYLLLSSIIKYNLACS
jgi:hypothetical protein